MAEEMVDREDSLDLTQVEYSSVAAVNLLLVQSSVEEKRQLASELAEKIQGLEQGNLTFLPAPDKYLLYRLIASEPSLIGIFGPELQKVYEEEGRLLPSDIVRTMTKDDFKVPGPEVELPEFQEVEGLPKVLFIGAYEPSQLPIGRFTAPPFGLVRMASFARNWGIKADIYDVTNEGTEGLEVLLKKEKFDYIGFSVLGSTILNDIALMHKVKKWAPNAKLIAGGQSANFRLDLMEQAPIDQVILGYGEYPIVNDVYAPEQEEEIPGLSSRENHEGRFQITRAAEKPTDKDLAIFSTTFDPKLASPESYWSKNMDYYPINADIRTIRISAQGLCPYNCTFCSTRNFLHNASGAIKSDTPGTLKNYFGSEIKGVCGSKVPMFELDPESFVNFIKRSIQGLDGVETIFINDDNFLTTRNKERFRQIARLVRNDPELSKLRFICSGRVDWFTEENAELAQEMRIKKINFGVETWSSRGLVSLKKEVRSEEGESPQVVVSRAIRLCEENGISPSLNMLIFYPEVDFAQLEETIRGNLLYIKRNLAEGKRPVEINLATFVRAYFGADILSAGYPTEKRINLTCAEDGVRQVEAESRIFPKDKKMRELARISTEMKSSYEEGLKKKYGWRRLRAPKEVVALVLFWSILAAGVRLKLAPIEQCQALLIDIDSTIAKIFDRERTSTSDLNIVTGFEPEVAEFMQQNNITLRSNSIEHAGVCEARLGGLKREGLLQKHPELITKLVKFQKELFNTTWNDLGYFKKYLKMLFHNYEWTRYWHLGEEG